MCCGVYYLFFFFFKQKTAYEMRISDWSSDVCSSDLVQPAMLGDRAAVGGAQQYRRGLRLDQRRPVDGLAGGEFREGVDLGVDPLAEVDLAPPLHRGGPLRGDRRLRRQLRQDSDRGDPGVDQHRLLLR